MEPALQGVLLLPVYGEKVRQGMRGGTDNADPARAVLPLTLTLSP